jgi:hypothetical protein
MYRLKLSRNFGNLCRSVGKKDFVADFTDKDSLICNGYADFVGKQFCLRGIEGCAPPISASLRRTAVVPCGDTTNEYSADGIDEKGISA